MLKGALEYYADGTSSNFYVTSQRKEHKHPFFIWSLLFDQQPTTNKQPKALKSQTQGTNQSEFFARENLY